MTVTIRKAEASDAAGVSQLILGLVGFFLSNTSSQDSQLFLATVTPQAVAERIGASNFRCHVAEGPAGLCGFVALRDGSHLHHLFVRSGCHRQGIARALWQQVRTQSDSSTFTVNSSLFAVPVYERLGFVATGAAQVAHGLAFVPMTWARGS